VRLTSVAGAISRRLSVSWNFLATRSDGAALLSRLQDAALADEEGQALAREIAAWDHGGFATHAGDATAACERKGFQGLSSR